MIRFSESVYAGYKCHFRLGMTPWTTFKWAASAFFSGMFVIRLLPDSNSVADGKSK